jgi:putative oxidoreductase
MAVAGTMALEGLLAKHSALPLRATLGSTMIYHGLSKLKGEGVAQTAGFFENIGIKPGRPWALATGWTEVLAGAFNLLGIATRAAALSIIVTQAVAIAKVHGSKGFDNTKGGYEFNLALIASALGVLLGGPGKVSVHQALLPRASRRRGLGLLRRQSAPPLARLSWLLA